MFSLDDLEQSESLRTIVIPLIVPSNQDVLDNRDLDLSFSPINACYSKPVNGKEKSWLDVRFTVEGEENLPSRKEWFYLVTDEGYMFKACFSGRGKQVKWLNSFENKNNIGDWIKTIFVEWDLIDE